GRAGLEECPQQRDARVVRGGEDRERRQALVETFDERGGRLGVGADLDADQLTATRPDELRQLGVAAAVHRELELAHRGPEGLDAPRTALAVGPRPEESPLLGRSVAVCRHVTFRSALRRSSAFPQGSPGTRGRVTSAGSRLVFISLLVSGPRSVGSATSEPGGMKLMSVPKDLNWMSAEKPVATRIGISPPTWNTAFWPLIASSFGCARIVARPSVWRAWTNAVMSVFGKLKAYTGAASDVRIGSSGSFCPGGTCPPDSGPTPPPMK